MTITPRPLWFAAALATSALAPAAEATPAPVRGPARITAVRRLLRAAPDLGRLAIARPLLTAAGRPACANHVSKGGPERTCTDGTNTTYLSGGDGGWTFQQRLCLDGPTTVLIDASGTAIVTTAQADGGSTTVTTAVGAATDPAVARCDQGRS